MIALYMHRKYPSTILIVTHTKDFASYSQIHSIDKADHDGKKPDIMIGTESKEKDVYFFYVEIKRPNTSSRYQVEDDSVKLMKEMKGSIDSQLRLGIKNPSSLGILVEGTFQFL